MARAGRNAAAQTAQNPPIFPQDAAPPPAAEQEKDPKPPAFPDMQNFNRDTADQQDDDMDASDGEGTELRQYICREKGFLNGVLIKPGVARWFRAGEAPPYFDEME